MIQTSHKAKLAKGTIYPLNATDMSMSLGDVISKRITLNFLQTPFRYQSYIEVLRNPYAKKLLVEFLYTNRDIRAATPRDHSKCPYIGEREHLYIYPILYKYKEEIYSELMIEGLPRLKTWLQIDREDTWRSSQHYFEIWWDSQLGAIEIECA